jgi:hypothetical protein
VRSVVESSAACIVNHGWLIAAVADILPPGNRRVVQPRRNPVRVMWCEMRESREKPGGAGGQGGTLPS